MRIIQAAPSGGFCEICLFSCLGHEVFDINKIAFPVDEVLEQVCQVLGTEGAAVLVAPPGAGKTTRVPPALLDQAWLAGRRLLMLEPRRLAARAAARHMAAARGEAVGETVGYRTRFDTRVSATTRVEVVTEGVLTRMLLDDPSLEGYGAILFDEFHERSLAADLGLALALEVREALRPDLRLLVMSATLDGAAVSKLLGKARLIESSGRSFPVTVDYSPAGRVPWLDHAANVARAAAADSDGSILVFVPGHREMHQLVGMLDGTLPAGCRLYALAGSVAAAMQDRILAPEPDGARKLVVATAVAETSLTIPDVRVVIDAGYERRPVFDVGAGMGRLVTRRVSRAAAEQRAGRAGRTAPGRAIRLWAASEVLAAQSTPELLSADLSSLVLDLAEWGCRDPQQLAWLDPPPAPAWQQAVAGMTTLGLLDQAGHLTSIGRQCQRLPLHPRLARMVIEGRARQLGHLAARLAVLLEGSVVTGSRRTDLVRQLSAFEQGGAAAALRQALKPLVRGVPADRDSTSADVGELLLFAFPDRVARRRAGDPARFLLRNGRGAWLPDDDELAAAEWLVAAALDGQARESRILAAASLDPAALERCFAEQFETRDVIDVSQQGRMRCVRQRRLDALLVAETPVATPDPAALATFFLEQLRQQGIAVLPWTPALRQWQARVQWLHRLMPEEWPDVSDETLMCTLDRWLSPYLDAVVKQRDWAALPLAHALHGQLDYVRQQQLDALLPERLQVPSGSHPAIDYLADGGPVLRIKLQEMFGVQQTPVLANGRLPLQLHLLSPAQRPVAVTADLASFWRQGYPQVRKDLRGRYPKHPWPEDPLTALPQRGVKHRPS